MSAHHYRSLVPPIGTCTLLADVRWDRVEAPDLHEPADRSDPPHSHDPFGVICTGRKLTAEEGQRSDSASLISDAWTGL
jgi:hypothetical protein